MGKKKIVFTEGTVKGGVKPPSDVPRPNLPPPPPHLLEPHEIKEGCDLDDGKTSKNTKDKMKTEYIIIREGVWASIVSDAFTCLILFLCILASGRNPFWTGVCFCLFMIHIISSMKKLMLHRIYSLKGLKKYAEKEIEKELLKNCE